LALFQYPTSSESAGAPVVLGDGTAEPLWVGDLTGDGMEDLLVESWVGVVVQDGAANWTPTIGPATVSLLPGPIAAGAPLPAPRWSTELAQTVETAAVAARSGPTLSGAGGEDLFVADYTAIYTFDPPTGTATRRLSTSSAYPHFAAEDLNGDGIGDLAWSDYNKAKIALGPWTADPRSGSDEDVAWETEGFSVRAVGSGDFNQDGIAELVFVQRDGAYLLPASGGGLAEEARAPHLVMRSGESLDRSSLAVGDANQDGAADLLLGDRNTRPSGNIWAFLGPILGTVDLDNADLRASGTGPSELGSGVAFGLSGDILTVASIPGEVLIWSLTE
ncbi:MAG TPA: VCBS repeat-containing protein, partial [Myxococcota bacterium]|nr:VCBS repeat-containing protein [Myxococcota bacterium]